MVRFYISTVGIKPFLKFTHVIGLFKRKFTQVQVSSFTSPYSHYHLTKTVKSNIHILYQTSYLRANVPVLKHLSESSTRRTDRSIKLINEQIYKQISLIKIYWPEQIRLDHPNVSCLTLNTKHMLVCSIYVSLENLHKWTNPNSMTVSTLGL